jgi:hypothetical protein
MAQRVRGAGIVAALHAVACAVVCPAASRVLKSDCIGPRPGSSTNVRFGSFEHLLRGCASDEAWRRAANRFVNSR